MLGFFNVPCDQLIFFMNESFQKAFKFATSVPQLVDYRVEFSKWWVNEFKTIKFPSQGTIFDYYIDPESKKFMPWTDKVPTFELDPDVPLQVIDRSHFLLFFLCFISLFSPRELQKGNLKNNNWA